MKGVADYIAELGAARVESVRSFSLLHSLSLPAGASRFEYGAVDWQ